MNGFNRLNRIALLCLIALFLSTSASAQSDYVRQIIDTVVMMFKTHSVNAQKVDWKQVHTNAVQKAANINHPLQMGPVIRYIYEAADEFHGAYQYGDSIFKLPYRGPALPDSVTNEWKRGITLKSAMLPERIGYIRIPYIPTDEKKVLDQRAQVINDSLCSLVKNNIRGMIVDLRLNSGGSMYPMISGLSALLDTGLIGSFVPGQTWHLRNNGVYLDTAEQVKLADPCKDLKYLPVVVLIGAGTGSSGEYLTIAFKGRKKTLFVGSPTSGYVTAIGGFDLKEKGYVLMSTAYGADRNGIVYREAIKPDVQVDGPDSFNDLPNDPKVREGIKWIVDHYRTNKF